MPTQMIIPMLLLNKCNGSHCVRTVPKSMTHLLPLNKCKPKLHYSRTMTARIPNNLAMMQHRRRKSLDRNRLADFLSISTLGSRH